MEQLIALQEENNWKGSYIKIKELAGHTHLGLAKKQIVSLKVGLFQDLGPVFDEFLLLYVILKTAFTSIPPRTLIQNVKP